MGLLVECETLRLLPHQGGHHQYDQDKHADTHPQHGELVGGIKATPNQRNGEKTLDDQKSEHEETERSGHRLYKLGPSSLTFRHGLSFFCPTLTVIEGNILSI